MTVQYANSTLFSIEKILDEEELRYNETLRRKEETDIVKSIQQEIIQLKAELNQQKKPSPITIKV